jgi:protein-S-isoprenylcysteine O-methyltransferase Ste14
MFLLYGFVSYSIFFVTFLYAIGFVNGLLVPKGIDSTPTVPFSQALITNLLLLGLFAVQHSVMARTGFKRWWTQIIPEPIERSTFVLLASLCLILLFWKWEPMGGVIWSVQNETLATILTGMSLLGFVIVLIATFLINHFELFGLHQVWNYFRGKENEPMRFKTPLLYKAVRHPIYMGFTIAFWFTPVMTTAHLVFAVMTTAYMLVAIQFEEKDLIRLYGQKYKDYRKRVPMLIPFFGQRKDHVSENPISTDDIPTSLPY